jgi:hypothetical protein
MRSREDREQDQTSTKLLDQSRSSFKHHFGIRRTHEVLWVNSVAVEAATFAGNSLSFLTNWKAVDRIECGIRSLANVVNEGAAN